ncbi:alpha/beta hydrolase [Methylobacterium planeticum]|uniref:Alpha/beta hydrolase n=1 Tax=Methylobacterium planeticum TaxID=2615211 RepID=A0A6N6MXN4_9HYPH|nr:alpha/beta hydrolase [Methylobacterium planeticum]KAB1073971.1 alpha/beta hydrolase [Methylobacterium planeticum]
MPTEPAERMDPREEHHRVTVPGTGLSLFLRRLTPPGGRGRPVLYVHGATFPSALSVAHRFPEGSWRDALCLAGLDVWALDFLGFGLSDRYPAMAEPAEAGGPLLLAAEAAGQVEAALRHIRAATGGRRISLLTHSWGSLPACLLAGRQPDLIDRLVLFGPIARRDPPRGLPRPDGPAWRVITARAQWDRFVEDVPAGAPPVLARPEFEDWAERYLDSDPDSRVREPQGVKVPSGPFIEILRAWHGDLPYDPALVRAPVCIVRGAWDGLATDADARWLFDAFTGSPDQHDIKIGRGTHLMHLEARRGARWRASAAFLSEGASV